MNIGTKKRKLYFQSIDDSVRTVVNKIVDKSTFSDNKGRNSVVTLEQARLIGYVTNTRLIQQPY